MRDTDVGARLITAHPHAGREVQAFRAIEARVVRVPALPVDGAADAPRSRATGVTIGTTPINVAVADGPAAEARGTGPTGTVRRAGTDMTIRAGAAGPATAIDVGFDAVLDAVGAGRARGARPAAVDIGLALVLDAVAARRTGRAGSAAVDIGLALVLDAVGAGGHGIANGERGLVRGLFLRIEAGGNRRRHNAYPIVHAPVHPSLNRGGQAHLRVLAIRGGDGEKPDHRSVDAWAIVPRDRGLDPRSGDEVDRVRAGCSRSVVFAELEISRNDTGRGGNRAQIELHQDVRTRNVPRHEVERIRCPERRIRRRTLDRRVLRRDECGAGQALLVHPRPFRALFRIHRRGATGTQEGPEEPHCQHHYSRCLFQGIVSNQKNPVPRSVRRLRFCP